MLSGTGGFWSKGGVHALLELLESFRDKGGVLTIIFATKMVNTQTKNKGSTCIFTSYHEHTG